MKTRFVMNIISSIFCIILLISVTYAWYIGYEGTKSVDIITANIASKVTLYEGQDDNRDGNVNLDEKGNGIFNELTETKGENGKPGAKIKLSMTDIAPTELFTWKINVLNMGDAAGYLVVTLNNNAIENKKEFIKYLSISAYRLDSPNYPIMKTYMMDALSSNHTNQKFDKSMVLFGYTENDRIEFSKEADYIFMLELESFDNLLKAGKVLEEDRAKYNSLQGQASSIYTFLDISLTSALPNDKKMLG